MPGLFQRGGVVGAIAGAALAGTASGTVLTFDLGPGPLAPNGVPMDIFQSYGDYVGGQPQDPNFSYGAAGGLTPNVGVHYGVGLRFGWSAPRDPVRQFGDLENVIYRDRDIQVPGNTSLMIVTLIADPGFDVCLFSFDLAALVGNIPIPVSIKVNKNPLIPLYQANNVEIFGGPPPQHNHFDFGPGGLVGNILDIIIDLSAHPVKIDRIGLDNITFGQKPQTEPPAPGVGLGVLIGSGILAIRRRRA